MYKEFERGHFDVSLCSLRVKDGENRWCEVAYSEGDECYLSEWYIEFFDDAAVEKFCDDYELTLVK